MWRFRGTPHYLGEQARRLGIDQSLADRARNNKEIYAISVLLAQLCERYHRAVSGGRAIILNDAGRDGPVFRCSETEQVRGTLNNAECELAKLHALAGSAEAMIDDAWRAFGSEPPDRHYAVMCDYDDCTRGKQPFTADANGVANGCACATER